MLATTALALSSEGNIISPDGSLVFIFVLFLIFVFVLNRVLFKPIGKVLDQRETLTEGARSEARAAGRRYQAQLEEYETGIRKARSESYRYLEQQRQAALTERQSRVGQARQEAHAEIERGKEEIQSQARQAREALETDARQLAVQISQTVLGRTVGGRAD